MIKSYKDKLKNVDERYYYIDSIGTAIAHKKDLSTILGVTARSIENYEKQGLRRCENQPTRTPMFPLLESIEWYIANITNKGIYKQDEQGEDSEAYLKFLENMQPYQREIFKKSNLDPIDKLSRLKDIERKEIRNKKESGELIEANKQDLSMAEQAIIHISHLRSYKKTFPSLLDFDGKSSGRIKKIVDKEFSRGVSELNKIVNPINEELEDSNDTLYDVVEAVLRLLSNGATPKRLIDKLHQTP